MSIVYITSHNECIYNTKLKEPDHVNSDDVTSKLSGTNLYEGKGRRPRRRKPYAAESIPEQSRFLRKGAGKPLLKPQQKGHARKRALTTPPVPTREALRNEQKDKPVRPPRDIIQENLERIQAMAAKQPPKMIMDSSGRKMPFKLKGGGNTASGRYGVLPTYVNKFIKEKETIALTQKQAPVVQPKCRYVVRDQRAKLLSGLKANWEELQSQYQGLPILTDTIPKIKVKAKMEADLKQLEKDIVLIERHPYIYVYNDEIE